MSNPAIAPASLPPPEDFPAGEAQLGRALAIIHRVLPRLDELDRADAVQEALRQAVALVEAARQAHERWSAPRRPEPISGEILALVAAAVAAVVGRPHRVVGIEKAAVSVAWVNAWAIEGRFQHYSSHKVR